MLAAIKAEESDLVATALRALEPGEEVAVAGNIIAIAEAIPAHHKFALVPLSEGADVRRFGARIGRATESIRAGGHVHVHNWKAGM